jgi:hypothetical protein
MTTFIIISSSSLLWGATRTVVHVTCYILFHLHLELKLATTGGQQELYLFLIQIERGSRWDIFVNNQQKSYFFKNC